MYRQLKNIGEVKLWRRSHALMMQAKLWSQLIAEPSMKWSPTPTCNANLQFMFMDGLAVIPVFAIGFYYAEICSLLSDIVNLRFISLRQARSEGNSQVAMY